MATLVFLLLIFRYLINELRLFCPWLQGESWKAFDKYCQPYGIIRVEFSCLL